MSPHFPRRFGVVGVGLLQVRVQGQSSGFHPSELWGLDLVLRSKLYALTHEPPNRNPEPCTFQPGVAHPATLPHAKMKVSKSNEWRAETAGLTEGRGLVKVSVVPPSFICSCRLLKSCPLLCFNRVVPLQRPLSYRRESRSAWHTVISDIEAC